MRALCAHKFVLCVYVLELLQSLIKSYHYNSSYFLEGNVMITTIITNAYKKEL